MVHPVDTPINLSTFKFDPVPTLPTAENQTKMSNKNAPPSPRYLTILCEFMAFCHEKPKPYPKEHEVSSICDVHVHRF